MVDNKYPRSLIVKDVTAKWTKIAGDDAPVNAFGAKQWEMQIQTTDPKKVEELKSYGLNVKQDKEDAKLFSVGLKRKGIKADGSVNNPVKVVDTKLQPHPADNIGNGSKVNVNLWQYQYEAPGRSGVATSLTAVQVVKLVEYTPTVGFDVIADPVVDDATMQKAEQKADEMPF
tara:strand:+ start:424 stop:942 length:519 start_codon:yes stop_codon:yes gene_type:complete